MGQIILAKDAMDQQRVEECLKRVYLILETYGCMFVPVIRIVGNQIDQMGFQVVLRPTVPDIGDN